MAKILYLNPLGIPDYDNTFRDMCLEYGEIDSNEIWVKSLAPNFGTMNHLEYRSYEALVTADTIKAVVQAQKDGFDAVIIGCFYDPVILEGREIGRGMVVIGPCQSSCEIATRISNKFSIIIGRDKWQDQMEQKILELGYEKYLASFRAVDLTPPEFITDPNASQKLIDAAVLAVQKDKAECIILGCTLETNFYQKIHNAIVHQTGLYVPVIDSAIAALKTAEHAVRFAELTSQKTSQAWGMEPPTAQELSDFGIFQNKYVYGNEILVSSSNRN